MRCGNCKQDHATVAEVRDCYGVVRHDESTVEQYGRGAPEPPPSEKALRYLTALLRASAVKAIAAVHELEPEKADETAQAHGGRSAWVEATMRTELQRFGATKSACSQAIDQMKAAGLEPVWEPVTNEVLTDWHAVPEGRYALEAKDGHVVFYFVKHKKQGKLAGQVIVVQLVGAPGDFEEQWIQRAQQDVILVRIAADPAEAALRFSRKFTRCSRCLSSLSLVQSRATGFGATCAGILGVRYLTREEALRVLDEEGITKDGLEDYELAL